MGIQRSKCGGIVWPRYGPSLRTAAKSAGKLRHRSSEETGSRFELAEREEPESNILRLGGPPGEDKAR